MHNTPKTLLAALIAVGALAVPGMASAFVSCHDISTRTDSGTGSSCAVFNRRRKAERAARDDARDNARDNLQGAQVLFDLFCPGLCESVNAEYAGMGVGGLCGETIVSQSVSAGSQCPAPSIGRRQIGSATMIFDVGCLCD